LLRRERSRLLCFLLWPLVVVPGCISTRSEIVPYGVDTYFVSFSGGRHATQGGAKAELLGDASEFCVEHRRTMRPVALKASGRPGPFSGWLAPSWSPVQAELVFECLEESDPRLRSPSDPALEGEGERREVKP
jgi:hypothetical protein